MHQYNYTVKKENAQIEAHRKENLKTGGTPENELHTLDPTLTRTTPLQPCSRHQTLTGVSGSAADRSRKTSQT